MIPRPRPVVLCILDGWGERPAADDNAIEQAKTPVWHRLMARWPHAQLEASEHFVGLPDGQMGNSEVGHTNIGAGRVVMQDLPRIDAAIRSGELAAMPPLRDFISRVKAGGGIVHLIGLMSPGGVHSHQRQTAAIRRRNRRSAILDSSAPTPRAPATSRSPRLPAAITRWTATNAGTEWRRPMPC
jgi:2,3-bisphosphoglycerate-independent phosphoglycerate mutase